MKQKIRWIYPVLFFLLCTAVISFLHTFMVADDSIQYINWTSAVQVTDDGTESTYDMNDYTYIPAAGETYRFTAALPEGLKPGYLLFETSGQELILSLNGTEIYHSSATSLDGVFSLAQAHVPLPENAKGELLLSCTLLNNEGTMFPPLLRFMPDSATSVLDYAYANLSGIPTGIAALTLLLVSGLFLLSIARSRTDWSLIPLLLAAAGLTVHQITKSLGYYFLPQEAITILNWQGFEWLIPLALMVFLLMNRHHGFWKQFVWTVAWSVAGLTAAYLFSLAHGGYLSKYLNSEITALFESGMCTGLLYWITIWLVLVCALLSVNAVMQSFVRQEVQIQTLELKNQLIMDNYHAIETKMHASAAMRHEFRHYITAMNALYQKGDYNGIGALLDNLKQEETRISQMHFTDNFTINAILQNAAAQAAQSHIAFDAQVYVPLELTIPEKDLCVLLMNMLDNALEACAKIEKPEERFLRFKADVKNDFLAVKCENSYSSTLKEDKHGHLLTTKPDANAHGFGMSQMMAVAEKYHSILDVSHSEDCVFTVQTALKLPKTKPL